jgi:acetyl esterase/lipase
MRIVLSLVIATSTAGAQAWQPTSGHVQVPLWPATIAAGRQGPKAETLGKADKDVGGRPWYYISNVSVPTLTVYSPAGKNTGAAMMVFPGGGYQILAIDLEGTEICDWLTARGITCVLLKYRVPNQLKNWDQPCGCDRITRSSMPIEDAQRALGLVRLHAKEWHIDPHKVGVIGFSAGGHLVAAVSTRFQKRVYASIDAADKESARPDFAVTVYPGHLFDRWRDTLFRDLKVTKATPPTLMIHAENDPVDTPRHTLSYYEALKDAKVPVELHMYAEGGHAFGLRRTQFPITEWPDLMEKWLHTIGMI